MNVDSIQNGIVIDHISAGKGMMLYDLLGLDQLDASIAIIKNVNSHKMGKKDIIKIDADIPVDLDLIGYVDKRSPELPEVLTDVIKCKNPRCITCVEQELKHVFRLTDKEKRIYRCIYCETKAN